MLLITFFVEPRSELSFVFHRSWKSVSPTTCSSSSATAGACSAPFTRTPRTPRWSSSTRARGRATSLERWSTRCTNTTRTASSLPWSLPRLCLLVWTLWPSTITCGRSGDPGALGENKQDIYHRVFNKLKLGRTQKSWRSLMRLERKLDGLWSCESETPTNSLYCLFILRFLLCMPHWIFYLDHNLKPPSLTLLNLLPGANVLLTQSAA